MTISYTRDEHNNNRVSTDSCPLCGVPLHDNFGSGDHILHTCPAAPAFREPGALKRGGPSLEEVEATIRREIGPDPSVAADGGEIPCDRCDRTVSEEDLRVHLQPSGEHEQLCQVCQTEVRSELLYKPSRKDGGDSE